MNVIKVLYLSLLVMLSNLGFAERPPSTVTAQDPVNITVSGVVLDANDARIVGAIVKFGNAKVSRQVKSDTEGSFQIELPPGDYQISAEHHGFRRFEFSPFRAKPGVCELVNIHMDVEAPKSTLKVN